MVRFSSKPYTGNELNRFDSEYSACHDSKQETLKAIPMKPEQQAHDAGESLLIANPDGTAQPRLFVKDADGTTYPLYVSPSAFAGYRRKRQKPQDTISAVEQVATRYQAKSTSDAEMEALLRWLIYKHYANSKRSRAARIRETSLTVMTASCRRRTRLYASVRAGLEAQYKPLEREGLDYKRGFLMEMRHEVAAQIDGVNSAEELANLPKAVQKVIAREARRCIREYAKEKRLILPDSDRNAIETVVADPKDDVQAFVNREDELAAFKALLDTGKLKGQKRELALILMKHSDLIGYGGNVEIARMLGWKPEHVRQVKRRLKIAANG